MSTTKTSIDHDRPRWYVYPIAYAPIAIGLAALFVVVTAVVYWTIREATNDNIAWDAVDKLLREITNQSKKTFILFTVFFAPFILHLFHQLLSRRKENSPGVAPNDDLASRLSQVVPHAIVSSVGFCAAAILLVRHKSFEVQLSVVLSILGAALSFLGIILTKGIANQQSRESKILGDVTQQTMEIAGEIRGRQIQEHNLKLLFRIRDRADFANCVVYRTATSNPSSKIAYTPIDEDFVVQLLQRAVGMMVTQPATAAGAHTTALSLPLKDAAQYKGYDSNPPKAFVNFKSDLPETTSHLPVKIDNLDRFEILIEERIQHTEYNAIAFIARTRGKTLRTTDGQKNDQDTTFITMQSTHGQWLPGIMLSHLLDFHTKQTKPPRMAERCWKKLKEIMEAEEKAAETKTEAPDFVWVCWAKITKDTHTKLNATGDELLTIELAASEVYFFEEKWVRT